MRYILFLALLIVLSACWPSRVSFVDGSMPDEWKTFSVKTIENNAPNTPLDYPVNLTEAIKAGVQNNTRLLLNPNSDAVEVSIDGRISNYSVLPVALQEGDNASKNRLSISVNFTIFISAPEESEMNMTATRFADFDADQDLSSIENSLLDDINKQIVQDVINKLYSNW